MKYGIKATRSAASVYGAAESWLKDDNDKVMLFDNEKDAQAVAAKKTAELVTTNINYAVLIYFNCT